MNCSTELMSANLESRILGKQGRLQTSTLNYFALPPQKVGKIDTNFLTCEKNRIRLLIGHTIFFSSEKNPMTNAFAPHQRDTIFIWRVCTG